MSIPQKQVMSLELNRENTRLMCGSDDGAVVFWLTKIHVFDTTTGAQVSEFVKGNFLSQGHNNKVFAVRMLDDDHTFVSAGWDANFLVWDLRAKMAVAGFTGVRVSGETLEMHKGQLYAG
jgi:WD40 repeat protein